MNTLRTGVFGLFVLLKPVSCEVFFTHTNICYFLDAFLMVYCITLTAFYCREKFADIKAAEASNKVGGIYQELDRAKDTDVYQELEVNKTKKKKAGKKKKSEPKKKNQENDKDPYESLPTSDPPPAEPAAAP